MRKVFACCIVLLAGLALAGEPSKDSVVAKKVVVEPKIRIDTVTYVRCDTIRVIKEYLDTTMTVKSDSSVVHGSLILQKKKIRR